MLVLLAVTIVVSTQTVGVGLVSAMLVTPAATAYLLVRRLPSMMALSAFFGALASLAGLYLSIYLNISSGAAIVLTATTFFCFSFRSSTWLTVDKTHPAQILIHLQRDNFTHLVVKLIRFFTDFNHMLLLQWQVKYIYTLVYLHR